MTLPSLLFLMLDKEPPKHLAMNGGTNWYKKCLVKSWRTSLVVQWFWFWTSTAGVSGLECSSSIRLGKQKLQSWGAHTRFYMHLDPEESNDSIRVWDRPPCGSWRVLGRRCRLAVAHCGGKLTSGRVSRKCELSQRSPFCQGLAPTTACRLECWDASGQTTCRVETHPSANRLLKVLLTPQLPVNVLLEIAPPASGQAPIPPMRKPAQPLEQPHPTTVWTPEARTTVLQSEENRPQTQKIRQNQMAKKYIPDKGTIPRNN